VALLGAKALYAADVQLQALRGEQQQVEARLAALRSRKGLLSEDDWYAALEPLLVEIAKFDQRIDAREAQLIAAGSAR
jgi:predicted xylose isomerase-like sugar epimerase